MSGGVRYNDTDHFLGAFEPSDFRGFGGLFGIRGGLRVFDNRLVYGRGKLSILMGDGRHDANTLALADANEIVRGQTEVGFGYEHRLYVRNVVLVPRIGMEWQFWEGYSIDPVDEHPDTDLDLFGFSLGFGIVY